jgi:hypothetical protein
MVEAPVFSAECRVGRLVEARLLAPRTTQQIADFTDALRRTFQAAGPSCVICADWRMTHLLAPDVADALVQLLRRGNAHVERSGVLLPNNDALFGLQVERVFREANHPSRRAFRRASVMRAWLAEVLDPEETRRLNAFLVDTPT